MAGMTRESVAASNRLLNMAEAVLAESFLRIDMQSVMCYTFRVETQSDRRQVAAADRRSDWARIAQCDDCVDKSKDFMKG